MEDERWNLANPFLVVAQTDATFGKPCIHNEVSQSKTRECGVDRPACSDGTRTTQISGTEFGVDPSIG